MRGFAGKILHVNLTTGQIFHRGAFRRVLPNLLGGQCDGAHITCSSTRRPAPIR